MPRTCLSVQVDLVSDRDRDRVFAAARALTFGQLAAAIDVASHCPVVTTESRAAYSKEKTGALVVNGSRRPAGIR